MWRPEASHEGPREAGIGQRRGCRDRVSWRLHLILGSHFPSEGAASPCLVAPFGSPNVDVALTEKSPSSARLRILFAGAMTQRKGLADLFAAMKLVDSTAIEFVIAGSPLLPLDWYRRQIANFIYEPPRSHG